MKNLIKIIFLYFILSVNANAQTVTWQKYYGNPQAFDVGYSIVQLPDEGYISVANGPSMRLDKYGNIIWMKNYSSSFPIIERTTDGNYLIGGSKLIKINIEGDTLWTRPGVIGTKIIISNDGGFYLCGAKFVDPFLTHAYLGKYDSLGYSEWEITYNKNIFDWGFSDGIIDGESNLVLIGSYSDSAVITSNPFIMKTDLLGNIIWFQGYNSDSLNYFYIDQIKKNVKEEFIAAGSNNLNSYFMHFSSDGVLQRINYIDSNIQYVRLYSLINTIDSGFAFTGWYYQAPNYYINLVKTDFEGNELWRKLFGNGYSNTGYCLRQTADSGFIIIGKREINFQSDIYIIKTDKLGFANPPVSINTNSSLIPNDFILYQNYPNPFNPETKIEFYINQKSFISIDIYNPLGQQIAKLLSQEMFPGKYSVNFKPDKLNTSIPSGIYFYTLKSENSLITKKMLYIK